MAFVMVLSLCSCFETELEFAPSRGKIEGIRYENAAFGISFFPGANWVFYNDFEIAEVMGVDISEVAVDPVNADAIYDMYAVNNETGSTVNVVYEKTKMSEKNYLKTTSAFLDGQFEAAGATVLSKEMSTADIYGEERPCLDLTVSMMGVTVYEKVIVDSSPNWIGTITIAALSEDDINEIIKAIQIR